MTELIKKLTAYGADMPGALERFLGDEEFYADCFRLLLEDPSFDALGAAMSSGDHDAAFDAAHTLKGVSGNLGLTPLYTVVCNLVEALRHGQYERLDAQYQAVLAARDALPQP